MSDELARCAQEILEQALAQPPEDRAAFVEGVCAGEPQLRVEVQSLLDALGRAHDFLETPVAVPRDETPPPDALVGEQIGQYVIRSVIASGGMGTVYLAEQAHPRRPVALKVLRAGPASRAAERRFEHESLILARLRHPNIAQVFEAGTHSLDGRRVPFFAMEHVEDARPLTTYARDANLARTARLELFAKICDAIHHGHQKGIIHRDVKPANLLVDASGAPKVIDFGIARIDDEAPLGTLATMEGQIIGTLQYMSPEQCSGRPSDVDTRADVYALGVVLYELLCGQPPYDVGTGTVLEAARVVCEQTPRRPSAIDPAVRGDLETIVLTALAKDRERRYASAASLAHDVRRFLAHVPIHARPPSVLYELRLFARRNRLVVAASLLALVALLAGSATSLAFGARASREARDRERAEQQARADAAVAVAVSDFLSGVLEQANPVSNPSGRELTLREALELAAGDVPDEPPRVAATIHGILGSNFRDLGARERSEQHLRAAIDAFTRGVGAAAPETVEAMNQLGLTLIEQRRLNEAGEHLERTLSLARDLPPESEAILVSTLNNMGLVHLNRGEPALAEPYLRESVERGTLVHGRRHPFVVTSLHNLGGVHYVQGDYGPARDAFVEALELRRELLGDVHPEIPQSLSAVTAAKRQLGERDGVEAMLEEGIAIRRELYHAAHPLTARSINNLASFLISEGRYEDAIPHAREALAMFEATLPAEHPDVWAGRTNLGSVLWKSGAYEEAEVHLLAGWAMLDELPAVTPAQRGRARDELVGLYEAWGRSEEAARWRAATMDGAPPDAGG